MLSLKFEKIKQKIFKVKNGQMADISRLIKECMVETPEARINTLRLRKTVGDLIRKRLSK